MRTIANGPVMDVFTQFDLQKIALLLDVDGTIVDIGPSPAEVHVGAGLLETLKRLFALMDGALALVRAAVRSAIWIGSLRPCACRQLAATAPRCACVTMKYFFGRSLCRTICASASRKAQALGPELWLRTRTILSRCTIGNLPGWQTACAGTSRRARRHFLASRPNYCRARRCSR